MLRVSVGRACGGPSSAAALARARDRLPAGLRADSHGERVVAEGSWRTRLHLARHPGNIGVAIADMERIQAAGGVLAFVEEDIDPTGPFGSFILTVLLAVATLERDNMVAGWKTAKARATERGAKIGPTPFGYQRTDEDDGVLQPHPDLGPVVTRAFRDRVTT